MKQRQKSTTLLTEKKNNNKNKKGKFGSRNRLTKLNNTFLKIITEEEGRLRKDLLNTI